MLHFSDGKFHSIGQAVAADLPIDIALQESPKQLLAASLLHYYYHNRLIFHPSYMYACMLYTVDTKCDCTENQVGRAVLT